MDWATITAELRKPLNAKHVKERKQAGHLLSYIEGWHAIDEANRIFGFNAWTRETLEIKCVAERQCKIGKPPNERDGWRVSYIAKGSIGIVGGLVREGWGAGHGIDADLGLAHESAVKEAETDAMKRCLMTFGNPFGLALYDKTQANVAEAPPEQIGPSSAYTKHLEALYHVNTLEGLKTWRESVSADSDAISDAEWTDLSNQLFNRKKAISQKEPA